MDRRSERSRPGSATEAVSVGGRWRLRHWRLRTKLLVVLVVPLLTAVALVGLQVKADLDRATRFTEGAARVRVDTTVAALVHELQRERDVTVRQGATGRLDDPEAVQAQRDRVDAAIGTFNRTLAESQGELSRTVTDEFDRVTRRLEELTDIRYAAEDPAFPSDAILRSYSGLVTGLLDISDLAAPEATDSEVIRTRLAAGALARVKDRLSVRRAVVAEALAAGEISKERQRLLVTTDAELANARRDFMKYAAPDQQRLYTDTVTGKDVDTAGGIVESVLDRAETGRTLHDLDVNEWDAAATGTVDSVGTVHDRLLRQVQQRSDALAADARRSAGTDAAIVGGVLVLATALAWLIARSLLRPLRVLRRSALEVADHKLPAAVDDILADPDPRPEVAYRRAVDPVPVFTREELGEVARAFDAVHGEAVRLAGQQALLRENINSMFVNLSRRSQDLVERQLTVLDRMEEHEQDPDILGGLFELDHLATRMRRNSENLLVLAGQDGGRPLPEPVSADEIVGAALSEVEHYQRITVSATPALAVQGEAVSDLVHVIAELFDNATRYSREPVSVVSSVTPEGEWQLDITDRGAGMPATEIERANARLADVPDVDVEVSRRMGLYVVARLAHRHGIRVSLASPDSADLRGLTATVVVPAGLIESGGPVPVVTAADTAVIARASEPAWQHVEDEPRHDDERELPEPEPGEDEHGAPFRAPVEWQPLPEWPTEDDDHRLRTADDLHDTAEGNWFEPAPRKGYESQDDVVRESDPREPDGGYWRGFPDDGEYESGLGGQETGERHRPADPVTHGAEDHRHPLSDDLPTDQLPALGEHEPGEWFSPAEIAWPGAEAEDGPPESSLPHPVRARMLRLREGTRRGRHAQPD